MAGRFMGGEGRFDHRLPPHSATTRPGALKFGAAATGIDHLAPRCYDVYMRTTVTIDDDVLAVARALAARRGSSLGSALSELARRGFKRAPVSERDGDGSVFAVADDAEPITSEDVYRSLDDWP